MAEVYLVHIYYKTNTERDTVHRVSVFSTIEKARDYVTEFQNNNYPLYVFTDVLKVKIDAPETEKVFYGL